MGQAKKKKIQQQKKEQEAFEDLSDYVIHLIVSIYVFVMLCIYPLYFGDKYFDMGDAKYSFFKWVTILFIVCASISSIVWTFAHKKEIDFNNFSKYISATDVFVIFFAMFSLLSFMTSYDYKLALVGYDGWGMGLLAQMAFVLIYFFVSRFYKNEQNLLVTVSLVGSFTALLVVLQRFSFNPLGMYTYTIEGSKEIYWLEDLYIEKFVSTLGQTSWYSSYAVLMIPISMYLYIYTEQIWKRVIGGICIALGFASLCTVNSDSGYVAAILGLLVFFWFTIEKRTFFLRFLESIVIALGTFKMIGILRTVFPERSIKLVEGNGEDKLTDFVIHSPVMLGLLIGVVVFYLLWKHLFKQQKESASGTALKVIRRIVGWGSVLAVWFAILLVILNTTGKLPSFLSKLQGMDALTFDDMWGNRRGFNWGYAVRGFLQSGLREKLIGWGPDCFANMMNVFFKNELVAFYGDGVILTCAHNEFLNMLVTEGIFGFVSYVGIFLCFIRSASKNATKNFVLIPYIAAVVSYMGHNFFCYQQCICTPMIFILMGLGVCHLRKEESNL